MASEPANTHGTNRCAACGKPTMDRHSNVLQQSDVLQVGRCRNCFKVIVRANVGTAPLWIGIDTILSRLPR